MTQDINVLFLVKGLERYVFVYSNNRRIDTLRTLGRFASNPELSFTWEDASVLGKKMGEENRRSRQNKTRWRKQSGTDV